MKIRNVVDNFTDLILHTCNDKEKLELIEELMLSFEKDETIERMCAMAKGFLEENPT